MIKKIIALVSWWTVFGLIGCGQTGSLYLPKPESDYIQNLNHNVARNN